MRPDVGTGTAVPIATVAVNVREYVDTGVRSLTSYRYAVTALNEKWQQQSGGPAVPITTSGLAALTNVTATDGIGSIDVRHRRRCPGARDAELERYSRSGRGGVNRAGLLGSCLRSYPGD